MTNLARQRGKVPILIDVVTYGEWKYHQKTGKWLLGDFLDEVKQQGIHVVDSSQTWVKGISEREFCALFDANCHGHYLPAGYTKMAEALYDTIQREGLVTINASRFHRTGH